MVIVEPTHSESFEDHPRNINFVYNQLSSQLNEEIPKRKMNAEKYFLMGLFFFFTIGLIISLAVLVVNVGRAQRAKSVAAEEAGVSLTPVQLEN